MPARAPDHRRHPGDRPGRSRLCLASDRRGPGGIWLDSGCALGRGAFELARRGCDLVLGVDLNFAMLRCARRIAATGRVSHPLRQLGIVYTEREFAIDIADGDREKVDFWACDAMALPFGDSSFGGLLSCNVLDCVASPIGHLMEIGRVVEPGKHAVIATPYDWSPSATPIEGWIGGHSQRSELGGDCVAEMRRLLSRQAPAEVASGLSIAAEIATMPWSVYVHERATMTYQVHVIVARATATEPAPSPGDPSSNRPRRRPDRLPDADCGAPAWVYRRRHRTR